MYVKIQVRITYTIDIQHTRTTTAKPGARVIDPKHILCGSSFAELLRRWSQRDTSPMKPRSTFGEFPRCQNVDSVRLIRMRHHCDQVQAAQHVGMVVLLQTTERSTMLKVSKRRAALELGAMPSAVPTVGRWTRVTPSAVIW